MNKYLIALIMIVIVVYMVVFSTPKQDTLTPSNTDTTIYYREFTVFLWNNEAYLLKLDNAVYPNVGCDAWDEHDENNHNCVIVGRDEMQSFFNDNDLDYAVNMTNAQYTPVIEQPYRGNI